jgi:hypothetical protein
VTKLKGKDHLRDLGISGRGILNWTLRNRSENVIGLVLDRVKWQAYVNAFLKS